MIWADWPMTPLAAQRAPFDLVHVLLLPIRICAFIKLVWFG